MARKIDPMASKKNTGARQEKGKIYVDELYFRHVDQVERWRREAEHYQTVENKLLEISRFSYEEFDYAPLLVRAVFEERVIPDYSYMLKDAQIAAEKKYFTPICIRGAILFILLLVLLIGTNSILLWMAGAGVLMMLIILVLMIQNRQEFIKKVLLLTQADIETRILNEQKKIADEKKEHESLEDERIKEIESLLAGEISTIFYKLDNILMRLNFFFDISAEIDLYNNIPSIRVWLPPKAIIPTTICEQQASGRPSFTDKEIRAINKQYLELCSGILIKIMSTVYSHIPTFNVGYIYGMSKEDENKECLIEIRVERETLIAACNALTGLEAIQTLKANFQCNTSLAFVPVEFEAPKEWDGVEQKLVRRLHINLFRS